MLQMRQANGLSAPQPFTTAFPSFDGTPEQANAGGPQDFATCGSLILMSPHPSNWSARDNIPMTERGWIRNVPASYQRAGLTRRASA
jgi:hypothetical protein